MTCTRYPFYVTLNSPPVCLQTDPSRRSLTDDGHKLSSVHEVFLLLHVDHLGGIVLSSDLTREAQVCVHVSLLVLHVAWKIHASAVQSVMLMEASYACPTCSKLRRCVSVFLFSDFGMTNFPRCLKFTLSCCLKSLTEPQKSA